MRLKRNERLVYVLEAALAAVSLLFTLFLFHLPLSIKAYCLVVALGVILMAALFMFGYHRDKHYLRPYISRIVLSCIMLVVIICFPLGLLLGYTHSSFSLKLGDFVGAFLPIMLLSIETELLRYVIFRSYFRRKIPVVIFTTIVIVMNILMALNATSFVGSEATFIAICTAFLPIIATELLCSYLCLSVGLQPALIYKMAARLYLYVLPFLPNLGHFLYAVVAIALPALIYLLTHNLQQANLKDQKRIRYRNRFIISVPIIAILLAIVCLVSGIFKHQIIAVASDSMRPTFVRGDAVILEKCSASDIHENDILVFKHEGIIVTHRVVQIDTKNNRLQFTTKGDHNEENDSFVTGESQVIGRVVIINKYIGFPTVWLSELFKAK